MQPQFDFTTAINRRGLATQKWHPYQDRDIIPMWVADMDLAPPPVVQTALQQVMQGGVPGYGTITEDLIASVLDWCEARYGWTPEPDWLVWIPGVVPALNLAVDTWLERTDRIAIQQPVYPPIRKLAGQRGRPLQTLEFPTDRSGLPTLDTDQLAAQLQDDCRALVLCNPQNPLGRVYRREELERIATIAEERDLLVLSDEIWADLILRDDARHVPFAALGESAARRSVTLLGATKTFNIAGLNCAFAVIPDHRLRQRFREAMAGLMPPPSYPGLLATEAAFRHGEPWRQALLGHLNANLDHLEGWLRDYPDIGYRRPEATYVVWLDVRAHFRDNPMRAFLRGGVALSDGADFGAPGFVRLNIGCPAAQLEEALTRMGRVLGNA